MKVQSPRLRELFKTPKRKTYTLVGITALIVGVFILLSIRPTFVKIADLNREIKDKETFYDRIDKKLETLTDLISQRQSVSQELVYFETSLPSDVKSGFLVANLSAIAESFNLDLMNIEFDEDIGEDVFLGIEGEENVDIVEVHANLEGGSSDMESYIQYLESFPRVFDIQSIHYSKTDLSKYEGDLSEFRAMKFGVTMYVFDWKEEAVEEGVSIET